MKKQSLLALIILIFNLSTFSQKNKDALYLKNGSQIFGKMEQAEASKIALRTSDGNLFVFDTTEIDHFVIHNNTTGTRKERGFGVGAELGFLAGPQSSRYPTPFSFGLSAGYTFNHKIIAEAGTGLEFAGSSYAPIYAGIRVLLRNTRTAPFIFGRAGYMTVISEKGNDLIYYPIYSSFYVPGYYYTDERDYKGGPTATIGFGASIAFSDMETYMSFAYRHFRTKEIVTTSYGSTEDYFTYFNRLEIKLGLKF